MNAQAVDQALPDAPTTKRRVASNSRAIWAALFWKEWCEHRWKMLAMSVIGLSILLPLWWTMKSLEGVGTSLAYTMMIGPLAALFMGMGLAAGEQATGTIDFVGRLPTERWRLALTKLIMAIVAVFLPLYLALFISPENLFGLAPVLFLTGTSLVLWFAVLGMNRPDEISAAAFGVAGVVLVWALFAIGCYQYNAACKRHPDRFIVSEEQGVLLDEWRRDFQSVGPVIAAALPGGILIKAPEGPADRTPWLWFLAAYATTHVPLAWRWLACYGTRSARPASLTNEAAEPKAWLGAPFASPTRAILWKQLRETMPVALAALALAAVWSLAVFLTQDLGQGSPQRHLVLSVFNFVVFTGMCAYLAAVVAGVGLFMEDLRPGVHMFWRAQPIPPDRWFWLKYTAGLGCLAVVFGGTVGAAWLFLWGAGEFDGDRVYLARQVQGVLGFWMVYAGAVCACCLVRQPLYAAILGVGFPAILLCACAAANRYLPIPDAWVGPLLIAVIVPASIAATLTAWQAVRRDWAILR